jgi:D-3-phosphoglycerate dehydrogenase
MEERKKKAVISAASWLPEQVKLLEDAGVIVKVIPDQVDELFLSEVRGAEALILGLPPVTRQIMESAPRLTIIACQGVGFNHVDVNAASDLGILVTNTPGINSDTVAEFTFGLILALARQIPQAWAEMIKGGWRRPEFWGMELQGKTLGVIGLGQIGRRVSQLGVAFGMKVLGVDPHIPEQDFRSAGADMVSMDQAVSQADVLTLHVPLTGETRKIIGARELARMKPEAFLINTARGGLVDEKALLQVLDGGMLAGAALDVFEVEPPVGRAIVQHPKVLSTPHLGGLTGGARYRMCLAAAEQVACALRGEKPPYAVNNPNNPRYLR